MIFIEILLAELWEPVFRGWRRGSLFEVGSLPPDKFNWLQKATGFSFWSKNCVDRKAAAMAEEHRAGRSRGELVRRVRRACLLPILAAKTRKILPIDKKTLFG
ncbi:MAG: hypothetical protein LJE67_16480 [Salaquimonas sp.]|jgi:hypothetical protein|nr:hypothetical protein [Salaquimonas sp.]